MADMEWMLEIALVVLLAATLFHAIRLERALGVLKRDRSVLEELVSGFNASTRQAEAGVDRLRHAADGAGRQLARQTEIATSLKDDLTFLIDRGERLADRMDHLIRTSRPLATDAGRSVAAEQEVQVPEGPRLRSQAERDLLKALRMTR